MTISPEELETCVEILQKIADDPSQIDGESRVKTLIAKIHRLSKRMKRFEERVREREADGNLLSTTGMISGTVVGESLSAPAVWRYLQRARPCYCCKKFYHEVHFFYHQLCPSCARLNGEKRAQRAELSGRRGLITGGRIKIGYQTALKLLRDGARVLVTTRFPEDAAARYAQESDFATWKDRLQIAGLDLRDLPSVERFAEDLKTTEAHLDILIHNAAQTIKRPVEYYRGLLENRKLTGEARGLIRGGEARDEVLLEARPGYQGHLPCVAEAFPAGLYDGDGLPVDLRPMNSWRLRLGDIGTIEMLEVTLVNAAAPFVLTSRLRGLMKRSPQRERFVVNVSAMEGQFSWANKSSHHPHTNMAKAALNMLTRTSAEDLKFDGIYMNSVDTGWITDEKPHAAAMRMREEQGFHPPLDVIDGAARIYDPIVQGVREPVNLISGQFLKDYLPYPW